MQVHTNSATHNAIYKTELEQKQEAKESFNEILFAIQSTNSADSQAQEKQKSLWDILCDFGMGEVHKWTSFGILQASIFETIKVYGDFRFDTSKESLEYNRFLGDKARDLELQWLNQTNPKEIKKIIELAIDALETHSTTGYALNENGILDVRPRHIYESLKNNAINHFYEILEKLKE